MRNEKKIFYAIFVLVVFVFCIALSRLNHRLVDALDDDLIVAAVTVIVIILLALFFFGFILSWGLVWLAQKNQTSFKCIAYSLPWIFNFLSLTSQENLEKALVEKAEAEFASVDKEMLAAIRRPKRRGRPSNYSYETMRRTVLAWENRGPSFPYTLAEFLDERFGSSPTGVPNVPNGTFYDWRKEILAEIQPTTRKK